MIGAGISGNKVPDLQKRLEKDVLAKKPTLVVIYIGINDVWHGENDPAKGTPKDKFEAGLKEIIGKIQDAGARVVLCTPTVIGEKKAGTNKLDAKLDEYAEVSRKVAKDTGVQLCDLRKAFQRSSGEEQPRRQGEGRPDDRPGPPQRRRQQARRRDDPGDDRQVMSGDGN